MNAEQNRTKVHLAPLPNIKVGFISTRFHGTDGVSLEVRKWVDIMHSMGNQCFFYSGLSDYPADKSMVVPEAFFNHPEIAVKQEEFFSKRYRSAEDTAWVEDMKNHFKKTLREFIKKFEIDLLIAQNCLTIPMNIPLGLAVTELVAETGIPTIAHHHDFYWERQRFLVRNVDDYLRSAFPPDIPGMQHVVINSITQGQIASRCGLSSTIIPNIMHFEEEPPEDDGYNDSMRKQLGIADDELFILQPTRVVPRKGIEHAIELVKSLGRKAALVISHASGDEGEHYAVRIRRYAEALGVRLIFASDCIGADRTDSPDCGKIYSLDDVYREADLITYPSIYEGFGNALLEAIYFRKPVVVNRYSIYESDIAPRGFKFVEFSNFITEDTVQETLRVLDNKELQEEMAETNYQLGLRYFSYSLARYKLRALFANAFGLEQISYSP